MKHMNVCVIPWDSFKCFFMSWRGRKKEEGKRKRERKEWREKKKKRNVGRKKGRKNERESVGEGEKEIAFKSSNLTCSCAAHSPNDLTDYLESKTLRMTRVAIKEHVFSMMSDDVVFEVLTLVVRVSLIGTLFIRAHIGHEIRLH